MIYDMLTGKTPFSHGNRKKSIDLILNSKPSFPHYLTSFAKDLMIRLLKKQPSQRLGSGPAGVEDIKAHSFFRKINWKILSTDYKSVEPPIRPVLGWEGDTKYFRESFLLERGSDLTSTVDGIPIARTQPSEDSTSDSTSERAELWKGFSFVREGLWGGRDGNDTDETVTPSGGRELSGAECGDLNKDEEDEHDFDDEEQDMGSFDEHHLHP